MQLLGIGPLELLFIAVIAVIVLGPKGMVSGAREAGKVIRKIIHSPIWDEIVDTSREIREFPRKIAREAGIEKDLEDLRQSTRGTLGEINRSHHRKIPRLKKWRGLKQAPSHHNKRAKSEQGNSNWYYSRFRKAILGPCGRAAVPTPDCTNRSRGGNRGQFPVC